MNHLCERNSVASPILIVNFNSAYLNTVYVRRERRNIITDRAGKNSKIPSAQFWQLDFVRTISQFIPHTHLSRTKIGG